MQGFLKMTKAFRLMNAVQLTSKFEQIEKENAWDELFYKINLRSDEQEKQLGLTFDAATSFENAEKNRYRNVLPYDQNRVVLEKTGGTRSSNYINASPLKIPLAGRNYILSQGPLPNTADDFWQMIHEQGAEVVIMLSKIMEKNFIKCHSYFPNKDNPIERYDYTECELLSEEVKAHYVVRRIRLTLYKNSSKKASTVSSKIEDAAYNLAERIGLKAPSSNVTEKSLKSETAGNDGGTKSEEDRSGNSRIIYHFQYMTWPDFGVPEHTDHFLEFLESIRNLEKRLCAERNSKKYIFEKNNDVNEANESSSKMDIKKSSSNDSLNGDSKCANPEIRPAFVQCVGATNNVVNAETSGLHDTGVNDMKGTTCINPPIVCHCSAGIGRTGAFVMIDTVLSILGERAKTTATSEELPVTAAESPNFNLEEKFRDCDENTKQIQSSATPFDTPANLHKIMADVEGQLKPNIDMKTEEIQDQIEDTERQKEEEDLAVASKKKMRGATDKPFPRGKIICSTTPQHKSLKTTNDGKSLKTAFTVNASNESSSSLIFSTCDEDDDNGGGHGMNEEDLETLCDLVVFMRKSRMGLIQTPQQLRFCWKAIVDWIGTNNKDNNVIGSDDNENKINNNKKK